MTKRISCFVLALVMVILAVPVFVFPATAARKFPYTAKWTDNLPVVDNSVDLSVVEYPAAAWTVGTKMSGSNPSATAYQEFEQYTAGGGGASKLIRLWNGSEWGSGGFYAGNFSSAVSQLFITPAATAIRYIAEYSGSATISLDSIFFDDKSGDNAATGKSNVAFAVLVNGEMVWPNKGADCFNDETKWYNPGEKVHTNLADEIGEISVELKSGDYVEFAFRKLSTAQGSWSAYKVEPVVTYTALAEVQPHSTAWIDYIPNVSHATHKVDLLEGPWTVGRIVNGKILPYDRHQPGGEQIILNSDHTGDIWGWSGMWTGWKEFGSRTMVINTNTRLGVGYTAEYTGTATISVRDILFRTENSAFAITLNGSYIFPANATDDVATWFKASALNANSGSEIGTFTRNLKQGDEIQFRFHGSGWAFANFNPVISYADVAGQNRLMSIVETSFNADKKFTGASVGTSNLLTYASFIADADLVAEYCGEATEDEAKLLAGYKLYFEETVRVVSRVSWGNNWAAGLLQKDGSFAPITNLFPMPDRTITTATSWDTQWMVIESAFNSLLNTYLNGGKPSIWAENVGCYTSSGALEPTHGNTVAAYGYTAPTYGYATLSYGALAALPSTSYIGVLIDGVMVWPNANADINSNSSYYKVEANTQPLEAVNASLSATPFYVEEGSVIQFVLRRESAWFNQKAMHNPSVTLLHYAEPEEFVTVTYKDTYGADIARYTVKVGDKFPTLDVIAVWDINGDGKADTLPTTVTEGVTVKALALYGKESLKKFAPTNNNGTVTYPGNWTVGNGTWSGTDLTVDGLTWTARDIFDAHDGSAFVSGTEGEGLWTSNGGGMYSDLKFGTKFAPNGIGASYTVPASGTVNLSFDTLTGRRQINKGDERETVENPIAYYVSILKNGEVIWPTSGSAFLYETKELYTGNDASFDFLTGTAETMTAVPEAFPTNLTVEKGDVISFIVNSGNASCWMFTVDPAVTYTALAAEPEAPVINETTVALGEKFAANFKLDVAALPEGATEVGVYVNGDFVELDDNGNVTFGDVAAKNLVDSFTVQPAYTLNGVEVKGEETELSVAEMLMQYVNGADEKAADLAIATLNYAAAAQKFFDYNTDKLANAALTDEQKAVAPMGTYSDGHGITPVKEENRVAALYGVKLILNDTVDVAVYFKSDVDLTADNYSVSVSDGEQSTQIGDIVPVGDGLYKAIIPGFMPTSWGTEYTFTLYNSENSKFSSDMLTYSITDYCVRMQNSDASAVVNAMLALYEAADAYN